MDVDDLLIDLGGLSDEEIEAKGRELYEEIYLNEGRLGIYFSHDQEKVIFWKNRFEHAFYSSEDRRSNPFKKDEIAIERIERIYWIEKLITGELEGSECWLVTEHIDRNAFHKRLYVFWEKRYIVWLEGKSNNEWKFSSAYITSTQNIRRYCKAGRKIWKYGE